MQATKQCAVPLWLVEQRAWLRGEINSLTLCRMANRLTRIYTRTGDAGTTGLADGSRVAKNAPRIEAIGAVDELNSAIGVLLCEDLPDLIRGCLDGVQHDLFDLGGELSVPG